MRSTLPPVTAFTLPSPSTRRGSPGPATRSPVLPASKHPIYRFMFCELFAFGFPPKPYALAARLALLERRGPRRLDDRRASTGIRPLIGEALARGGNIPAGLDDAPFRSPMSNLDWVEAAVRTVRDPGERSPPRQSRWHGRSRRSPAVPDYILLPFADRLPAERLDSRSVLLAQVQAVVLLFYPVTAQGDPGPADFGAVLIDVSAVDDR
jgi:hypothetical protein